MKVSQNSILEHCKTCPGCYRIFCFATINEYRVVLQHRTPTTIFNCIKTLLFQFDKTDEFLVLGGGDIKYRVKFELSGVESVENCISYEFDAEPRSALREDNALEVHQSIVRKIAEKTVGEFKLEIRGRF